MYQHHPSIRPAIILYLPTTDIVEALHNKTSYQSKTVEGDIIFTRDDTEWLNQEVPEVITMIWERANRLTKNIPDSLFFLSTEHTIAESSGVIINDYKRYNVNLLALLDRSFTDAVISTLLQNWYIYKKQPELVRSNTALSRFGRVLTEFYLRKNTEIVYHEGVLTYEWLDHVCVLVLADEPEYEYSLSWTDRVCVAEEGLPGTYDLKWKGRVCVAVEPDPGEYLLKWTDRVCVAEAVEEVYDLKWKGRICNIN